ncbi:MAG TPA: BACON domain-containing carbohydrate-binding protein, partial [Thermoanaerobaculia bacterium]
VSWITVLSGATGTGNGMVTYSVAPNLEPSARHGVLTVASQSFLINQESSSPCTYVVAPTSQSVANGAAATGSFTVSVAPVCPWTAASNVPWITITGGGSGTGNGTVSYQVAANPSASPRTGALTVGDQTVTVTQGGVPCAYSLSPASQSMAAAGGNGSVTLTAPLGCGWTGASNAAWIVLTGGNGQIVGSGGATIGFTVAANTGTLPRTGTLTLAGQTFTVNQSGAPCTYSISPTSQSLGSGAGSGSVSVTAGTGCSWTAASNAAWITITAGASGSGSGNGSVSYSVVANLGTASRTGTLTLAGQTFSVTQAGSVAPPAAPSNLTASVLSSTQVQLSWTDNSANETGFTIERLDGGGNSGYVVVATVGANVTAYTNAGLTGGTSYSFRVRATNAAGASAYSNVASVTTPGLGFSP